MDIVTNSWLRKGSSLGPLPQGIFRPKKLQFEVTVTNSGVKSDTCLAFQMLYLQLR